MPVCPLAALANMQDDIGTLPGQSRPTNRSNRFDVANDLNALMGVDDTPGPFWCADPNWCRKTVAAGQPIYLPQAMPRNFVSREGVAIPQFRISDERIKSDFPFRLFGNGSVGSQMLTGIPRLQQLRQSPQIGKHSQCSVWPFETGWATDDTHRWLGNLARMVLAEIYPSIRPPLNDTVLDRGQVRAMWHWARDLDMLDHLKLRLARPNDLTDDAESVARCEEGWILH